MNPTEQRDTIRFLGGWLEEDADALDHAVDQVAEAKDRSMHGALTDAVSDGQGRLRAATNVGLIERLSRFIVSPDYVQKLREPGHHVSQMAKFCAKRAILDALFPENIPSSKTSATMQHIFDAGTMYHAWYQNVYFGPARLLWGNWRCLVCRKLHKNRLMPRACKACQAPQAKLVYAEPLVRHRPLNLVGHCDGILLLDGKWVGLEIKTVGPDGWNFVESRGAKLDHVYQLNIYMHLLNLKRGVILYINKADSREMEFVVDYDPLIWQDVETKLIGLFNHNKAVAKGADRSNPALFGKLPGLCRSPDSWAAKWCHQAGVCFALTDKANRLRSGFLQRGAAPASG